jgi:tetratricopeptide (TPR) repeat protein
VKAVDLDRSLIGSQQKLIELGLSFFSNPKNLFTLEEKTCYLGFYSFFAGDYENAARELKEYVAKYPDGSEIKNARSKLEEIALLEEQLKSASQQKKPAPKQAKDKTAPEVKPVVTVSPPASLQQNVPEAVFEEKPAYVAPQVQDEYAALDSAQLFSEAMAIASERPLKAIGILGKAIKSGNASPEVYGSLADIYASRKGFEKDAISTYREIMEKFPGTSAAADAKQKILKMSPSPEQRAREVNEYFLNKQ